MKKTKEENMSKGRIDVEIYFDSDGNRTCATNFEDGSVCKFYRTQRFSTRETCLFAPWEKKYAEQIPRRGDDGRGTLIPPAWCPIVVDGNTSGYTKDIKVKDELGVETKKEVEKEVKKGVDVESTKVKKGDGSVRCIKAFIQEAFMTGRVDENTSKRAIAVLVRKAGHSMRQKELFEVITEVQDQWKSRQSSWSDSLLELPKGDVVRTSDLNEVVMAVVHLRSI